MRRSGVTPVSLDAAVMLIGGIAELVAHATCDGRALSEVGDTAKAAIEPR